MPNLVMTSTSNPSRRIAVLLGKVEWAHIKKEIQRQRKDGVVNPSISGIIRKLIRTHLS